MGYAMQHKTDTTAAVQVRLRGAILTAFENWRRAQSEIPSKAEALRQLVELGLDQGQRKTRVALTGARQ